ncbi:MAG TPA: hypothetical protein VF094_00360 [Gaiellaceae bacterium]
MKDALSVVAQSRTRLAVLLALIAVLIAGGVTLGSWAVGSDPGSGYAKAVSGTNLTLNEASALTTAQLHPGGTGDVVVSVNNTNPFPVTVTAVNGAGTITSNKGVSCDAATGVTFAPQTPNVTVPANTGLTPYVFTLAGAASMSNASDNSCQGAIFTIPVTLTGTS